MKRYGNLFERVVEYGNLEQAFHNAARHKTRRSEVIEYGSHLEANLLQLQRELITGTYRTSEYKTFIIYEPKERKIFKLPFRDRVVHWAIMQVIEPIWLSNFTRDTYSCIRGRGIHPLLYKLRRDLKADPEGTRYCLKIDVRKFYPSIDHEIMKQVIRRKLKDARLLALLDGIVDSAENGVPIGNYLSQFFANLYLSELDHIMKEEMGIRYYYRFADDIVLLDGNKEKLHGTLVFINHYLNNERALSIKPNYQVFPVESRGVNYVGYVTFHDYCLARKQNKKNLCREVAKLRKRGMSDEEIRIKASSRLGFMQHCNSIYLLKTLNMKTFSEVTNSSGNLTGDKYHIDDILNREIHLKGFEIKASKYKGECLIIQYDIYEQVKDKTGALLTDDDGSPKMDWVEHITFTGSEALIKQLKDVVLDEPCSAKIIKQPIGDLGKCFYKITDPD